MKMMRNWKLTSAVVVWLVLGWLSAAAADNQPAAFAPGEKLTFDLRWGIIPAGHAVLEVRPMKSVNGVLSYHFVMQARTNSFLDNFYRYRGRVDAYANKQMTRSLRYHKKTETGSRTEEDIVDFDWEMNQARFHRTRIEPGRNPETQTENKRISLMPGSFDPLSAFYYTRQLDVGMGAPIERPVSDGKKCVVASAMILRRETIRLNGKDYDTFLVQPDLKHVGGVFKKSKNAKIYLWVTADERRIPIKIKSKVVVGHFTGELVSMQLPAEAAVGSIQPQHAESRRNDQTAPPNPTPQNTAAGGFAMIDSPAPPMQSLASTNPTHRRLGEMDCRTCK